MTKIDIISGFLGAGKTTLIKKLLSDAYKGEQVVLIAKLLNTDEKELLTLWLADQIFSLIEDKKELATNALSIVLKNLKNETSHE